MTLSNATKRKLDALLGMGGGYHTENSCSTRCRLFL